MDELASKNKNYQYLKLFLLALISLIYSISEPHAKEDNTSQPLSAEKCGELYQGWVMNSLAEDYCSFGGLVSKTLGPIIKTSCHHQLNDSYRDTLTEDVLKAFDKDINTMSKEELCADLWPGYKQVSDEIFAP